MTAPPPPEVRPDCTVDQNWDSYTPEEHAVWHTLFRRQEEILPGRAAPEFVTAMRALEMSAAEIPRFERLTDMLTPITGWSVVAVPGLVPDAVFFDHLAARRFPVTRWIRDRQRMDYLEEPDLFHDLFGHVPLLMNPVFADYMAAYGRAGRQAAALGCLEALARLYWYTVEFGLIATPDGLRIYGAGIVSSKGESVWSLDDPSPNRIAFDLERVMATGYRIDDYQETYFVIDSYERLFAETTQDLTPLYRALAGRPALAPGTVLPADRLFHRGTGCYHAAKRRAAE